MLLSHVDPKHGRSPRGTLTPRPVMWWRRTRTDEDLREEIDAHLAHDTDRRAAEGLSPNEARAAAHRAFGNVTWVHEQFYESRRVVWLDDLRRDARHAVRTLRRTPSFTVGVVVTLALGLGASTAILAVARAVLLRALPYPAANQLVAVVSAPGDQPQSPHPVSYLTFLDWQRQVQSLNGIAAYVVAGSTLSGSRQPTVPVCAAVTSSLFSVLRVTPLFGRTLAAEDDTEGAPRVVVIGEQLWRNQLEADPQVLGRSLTFDGVPHTVVGVMRADFRFPHLNPLPQVWMPVRQFQPFQPLLGLREASLFRVVGRLGPHATRSQAQAELSVIATRLAREYPDIDRGHVLRVEDLQASIVGDTRSSLLLLLSAVGLLLLIASTNVLSLHLTRMLSR